MRAEGKEIGNLLAYMERFKAKRSVESEDFEYFVIMRLIIPVGVTVTYGQIR